MRRIDAFTTGTGNLLHYLYHQNYYKLIGIDYQDKKKSIPQRINFTGQS